MVYKRYVKRGGKTFGPYYYESYRGADGKVKTRYLENYKPLKVSRASKVSKKHVVGVGKIFLVFALVTLLGFFAYSIWNQNNNGLSGQVISEDGNGEDISGSADISAGLDETIITPVESEII
ncbi:MAG: hypothetical protein WCP89_02620, partial [archaeon]